MFPEQTRGETPPTEKHKETILESHKSWKKENQSNHSNQSLGLPKNEDLTA